MKGILKMNNFLTAIFIIVVVVPLIGGFISTVFFGR